MYILNSADLPGQKACKYGRPGNDISSISAKFLSFSLQSAVNSPVKPPSP